MSKRSASFHHRSPVTVSNCLPNCSYCKQPMEDTPVHWFGLCGFCLARVPDTMLLELVQVGSYVCSEQHAVGVSP